MSQIQEGDVVTLKSGGPKMTVTATEKKGKGTIVVCRYYDKNNKSFEEKDFMPHDLKKLDDNPNITSL
jgi:uncharacterized protein YodC (DUF2158 family)